VSSEILISDINITSFTSSSSSLSLEAFENSNGELSIKTYYNTDADNYIIANFNEEQVMELIDQLDEFLNTYGHGRVD